MFDEKVHLKAGIFVNNTFILLFTPSIRQKSYYYFVHSLHGVVVLRIIKTKQNKEVCIPNEPLKMLTNM